MMILLIWIMPTTEVGLAKQKSQKKGGKAGINHGYNGGKSKRQQGWVWNVDESMTYLRKKKITELLNVKHI